MKIKEIINEVKKEIKNNVEATLKGAQALLNLCLGVIVALLLIGLFTGRLNNVIDNLFLKHYYIYTVKSANGPSGEGKLGDFIEENFTNVEWDFKREEVDGKIVSVAGDEEGNRYSFFYIVNDGVIKLRGTQVNGQSLENYISDSIDNVFSEDDSTEVIEDTENEVPDDYGTYKPNELGKKYFGHIRMEKIDDISDTEKIREMILDMKFAGYLDTVGDSLNDYLEDIEFSDYQTEKGTTINIKGYSDKSGKDLMISILATYEGSVYLTEIRQGNANTMMDMSTQLKIANAIFE